MTLHNQLFFLLLTLQLLAFALDDNILTIIFLKTSSKDLRKIKPNPNKKTD
jgi:hypothetical protein